MNNVGLPFELRRACPPARVTPEFGSTPVGSSSDNDATACCLSAPAAFVTGESSDNTSTGCPVREIPHRPVPRAAYGRLCAPCRGRLEVTGPFPQSTHEAWHCGLRRSSEATGVTPSVKNGL